MDSEKVIIGLIKTLLKDYLTFTKGEVPNDWVNVREERQADIERLQREINDLNESIKNAKEFNEDIEQNAIESLKRRKPGMVDGLKEDIKENKEKIETYRKRIQVLEGELERTQKELEEANAQIETRRQARIVKIKQEIRDNVRQYVEEEKEASKGDQEKLDVLKKYEEISEEEIQNLASMVESQEKSEIKASKIEAIKQGLEAKEENCKDLLTQDYYLVKEEYIKELEKASIEEVEEMKAVTIGTIYKQVLEKAIKERDIDKANSVYATVNKIVDREEIIRRNILAAEESRRKQVEYSKNDIQFEEEKSIVESITQAIKEIPNKISKAKQVIGNIGIRIANWSVGMKLLGDGKEGILIDDEQIHERWQKNEKKHEQLMKDISEKRQVSSPNRDREETSQTDLQKQLEVAQEANDVAEIDYLSRLMQAASQVTIKIDEERKKEWEAYRKTEKEDIEESQLLPKQQINEPLEIPQFLKDYGATKKAGESLGAESLQVEQRKAIKGFSWIKRFFSKAKDEETQATVQNNQKQGVNLYKQGLNAGLSQEEQSEHVKAFQQEAKENKSELQINEIAIEGQ